ncbi:MAG: hypothetical protein AAFY56_21035 [Pseudomonadota bacterium]
MQHDIVSPWWYDREAHFERDRAVFPAQLINLDDPETTRALLRHIVDRGDVVGEDLTWRPVLRFEFAAEPWLLDKLANLGAAGDELEAESDQDELDAAIA